MNTTDSILLLSLLGVSFSYFIYPVILYLIPKQKANSSVTGEISKDSPPFVTLIITAFNEESKIKEKIQNTLDLDYPVSQREILVASDGSTDKTNEIVLSFKSQGVKLVEVQERKGKENAQLSAIQEAQGEILVFSDVATQIPKDAIWYITQSFENPNIGAISSEDRFITEDGQIAGEGAYVKYEMWLRRLEASVRSLVGLSGSFFSCRKQICDTWNINVPSDFNTALNCISHGYIAISHPLVLGYYPNLKDESKEYNRKLRTVIRGMAAILNTPSVLNPFKFGIFSFMVFSHKIMRWLVPWFMVSLLFTNTLLLQNNTIYQALFAAQLLFYLLALIGHFFRSSTSYNIFKIPFFFMQVNIAIAHAGLLFLVGKRITMWEPSKR